MLAQYHNFNYCLIIIQRRWGGPDPVLQGHWPLLAPPLNHHSKPPSYRLLLSDCMTHMAFNSMMWQPLKTWFRVLLFYTASQLLNKWRNNRRLFQLEETAVVSVTYLWWCHWTEEASSGSFAITGWLQPPTAETVNSSASPSNHLLLPIKTSLQILLRLHPCSQNTSPDWMRDKHPSWDWNKWKGVTFFSFITCNILVRFSLCILNPSAVAPMRPADSTIVKYRNKTQLSVCFYLANNTLLHIWLLCFP